MPEHATTKSVEPEMHVYPSEEGARGAAATRFPPEDLLYAITDDGSDRIEITELVSGDSISIKKEHAGWLARDLIRYAR